MVQCFSDEDQFALVTVVWKWMFGLIPSSSTVSFTYSRIAAPSAMAMFLDQGLNANPKVCRSESDLMPGYLKRSHVPPERTQHLPTLHGCFTIRTHTVSCLHNGISATIHLRLKPVGTVDPPKSCANDQDVVDAIERLDRRNGAHCSASRLILGACFKSTYKAGINMCVIAEETEGGVKLEDSKKLHWETRRSSSAHTRSSEALA